MSKLSDDHIRWILDMDAKGVQSELTKLSSQTQKYEDDNKKLRAEIKEVEKQLSEAEKAMEKLTKAGKKYSNEFQQAEKIHKSASKELVTYRQRILDNNKAIEENVKKHDTVVQSMRIEDMTMVQLEQRAKSLENQLRNTSEAASPEAYEALSSELDEVKDRMGELGGGTEETSNIFSGKGAKAVLAFTAALAIAKKAFDVFENVMMSNRATGIEFKGMMDGLNNALDYMKSALANLDFTNFLENLRDAYDIGRKVSIMLEEVYDMENSFKLTSGEERAEIEELKTQLRDVNLTNKERIEIGNEILARTQQLADEETKINEKRLEASKLLLQDKTKLTDAELEYIIVNRNANEQDIENINKIKDLEGDLIHLRKNRDTYEKYSNNRKNSYYVRLLEETQQEIDQYEKLIEKLKHKYGFLDPELYEIAYNATQKYLLADKEAVDNYVNSRVMLSEVNIKTAKELRQTHRLISTLTKKETDGGKTPEQRQRDALNELNKSVEIKYQKELLEIKKEYKEGEIETETEYNRRLFAADQANYLMRKEALEDFLKQPLDKKVRSDIEKELATLETKRLDQEIKFRAELEKVILNANPIEKEKRAFEERLSAAGLYGIEKEKMTEEQLQALELLEKQHQENLDKIELQAEKRRKTKAEKDFEDSFKDRREEMQVELNNLMHQAASMSGSGAFEAEMSVHLQRLKMINEEVAARNEAGLDIKKLLVQQGKEEAALTKTMQKEATSRYKTYSQYTNSMGTALGNVLSGQEDAMQAFGDSLIDIFFDIISKIIETKIMEATAVAVAEQAKAAAIAAAMPDSVATFGASAAARTAAIGAIIMGALQAAKTVLKGMLTNKTSSSSSSTGSGSGERVYSGFADGGYHEGYTGDGSKYEVKGFFPDGQPYHAGEYIIPQEVLRLPAIAPMVRQIESARKTFSNQNPLPAGFAEGGYHSDSSANLNSMDSELIKDLTIAINKLNEKEFDFNYYKFEKIQETINRARSGASKRG